MQENERAFFKINALPGTTNHACRNASADTNQDSGSSNSNDDYQVFQQAKYSYLSKRNIYNQLISQAQNVHKPNATVTHQ
jgi:hypothetical protein